MDILLGIMYGFAIASAIAPNETKKVIMRIVHNK